MSPAYPNADEAQSIALFTIGWIVSEPRRAERFLGLTGLDAEELRAGVTDAGVQAAALDFLLSHEPDLISCAQEMDVSAETLVAARQVLVP